MNSGNVNCVNDGRATPPLLTTFFPFSGLPTELRLRIWRLAEARRRIVPIQLVLDDLTGQTLITSTSTPPTTLHVCRESRSEALRRYVLAFGPKNSHSRYGPGIYFDFENDILKFGNREGFYFTSLLRSVNSNEISRVRTVSLTVDELEPFSSLLVCRFSGVTEIIVDLWALLSGPMGHFMDPFQPFLVLGTPKMLPDRMTSLTLDLHNGIFRIVQRIKQNLKNDKRDIPVVKVIRLGEELLPLHRFQCWKCLLHQIPWQLEDHVRMCSEEYIVK